MSISSVLKEATVFNWHPPVAAPHELRAAATHLRTIADFFEENPKRRTRGMYWEKKDTANGQELKVCAIGCLQRSRALGIKLDPTASRNLSVREFEMLFGHWVIEANDDPEVTTPQLVAFLRHMADATDIYAFSIATTKSTTEIAWRDAWVNAWFKACPRYMKSHKVTLEVPLVTDF